MDSVINFGKDLFAFDAYWKVVVLIFFFGTICAYVFTRSLKDATTKYYVQKGVPVSPWRGLALTIFSSVVGGVVGAMLDISILPIVAKAGVCEPCPGETASIIVPHYTLLSVLCGVGAGVLSSFSFPFIRGKLARWTKKGDKPTVMSSEGIRLGRSEDSDTGRETFSWTASLDRRELLERMAEESDKRKAEKEAANEAAKEREEAKMLEEEAALAEAEAEAEKMLAAIKARKAALHEEKDDE